MAGGIKEGFVRLMRNLQEPEHVARFQRLCGVRELETRDRLRNGSSCVSHGDNQNGGGDGIRLRAAETETAREKRNNGVANGAAAREAVDGAQGSTIKPMRRNSLTGDVGQEFVIENKLLFYLFTLGTELGNELFYICFFPCFMWNVDAVVSRRLVVVWVWVMYLGQCTKDVIRWPRPASPPVVKVEMFYNSEYSMPSTHAMSGTAIPVSLFLITYSRWEVRQFHFSMHPKCCQML